MTALVLTITLFLLVIVLSLLVGFLIGGYVGSHSNKMPIVSRHNQWSIGLYMGDEPYRLKPLETARNPVFCADDVTDIEADYVADPFMIQANGSWFMFVEALNKQKKQGEIALASSTDGRNWRYEQVVLTEPFHLSYPYVFEWAGTHYMVPESSAASTVRLYKATNFPFEWTPVATLLHGCHVDPTLFRHNGMWWMFTAPHYSALRLFFSDALEGPWAEHPMSPVVQDDARIARPAGRVVVHNGQLVRFAQDCTQMYGLQVHAFLITELTPKRYAEREARSAPVLAGSGAGWNKQRMHHVDAHRAKDGHWIACADGDAGVRFDLDFRLHHFWRSSLQGRQPLQ